jgi:hypothetical protein
LALYGTAYTSPRPRGLLLLVTGVCLASCAGGAAPPTSATEPDPKNRIVIPDAARPLDEISLFHLDRFARLNEHMTLVWSRSKPYLIVSDAGCPGLSHSTGTLELPTTHGTTLQAGTTVLADDVPCRIDRIYSVTSDEASSLRETFRR